MDVNDLKKSPAKVADGDWVKDIPQMGDLELKVRGLGSTVYRETLARKLRAVPSKERERDGTISDAVEYPIRGQVLHECILLDWKGLENEGKAFPFDKDVALSWLMDPAFEDFHYAVMYAAGVVGKQRKDGSDDVKGN